MSARVADVMMTNAVAVRASASFKEIAARLREQQVNAFPVIDEDDRVIGVVSEADLLPKEALEAGYEGHRRAPSRRRYLAERQKAAACTATDLMSRPAITVGPYDLVSHAAHLMYDYKVTILPVVDRERLVGVVRRADVLGVFGRPDEDIRLDIIDRLIFREFFADPGRFTVTVQDGVVTLQGRPETADDGHDLVTAVRHTEGVVAVRDELTYPPPARRRSGQAPVLNAPGIMHRP